MADATSCRQQVVDVQVGRRLDVEKKRESAQVTLQEDGSRSDIRREKEMDSPG